MFWESPTMATNKVCKKCGKSFGELYQDDYCYDCYAEIWSDGFEVSSEWGANIAHRELIGDLNEIIYAEEAKSINIVKEILSEFYIGAWTCSECGNVKINQDEQEELTPEQIIERLKLKCPVCGKTSEFDHEFRGVY